MEQDEITFEQTCAACPEQYDAVYQGQVIGYLRLRHGYFRVDYPNCGGDTIYEVNTVGDGCFNDDTERMFHLSKAKELLVLKHNGTLDLDTKEKCKFIIETELPLWLQDMCSKFNIPREALEAFFIEGAKL